METKEVALLNVCLNFEGIEKVLKLCLPLWVYGGLPSPSRLWLQVDKWAMGRETLELTAHHGTHCRGEPGTLERGYSGPGDHDLRKAGERTILSHSVPCGDVRGS